MSELENVSIWKGIAAIAISWLVITLAVVASLNFFWFYPFAVFIIANRIMTLGLLTHEGIHYLLFPGARVNDFLARYFCAFPMFISLSRWRIKHGLHHKFIGSQLDLDKYLYTYFPMKLKTFLWRFFSGQIFLGHFIYFSDLDYILGLNTFFNKIKKNIPLSQKTNFSDSDFFPYLAFQGIFFSCLWSLGLFKFYLLYWLIPYIVHQPYVLVYNCLQHAGVYEDENLLRRSRSITGPGWLMSIVLPLNVNFHNEHHFNSRIPQYNLKAFSETLSKENEMQFYGQGYFAELMQVFQTKGTNEK